MHDPPKRDPPAANLLASLEAEPAFWGTRFWKYMQLILLTDDPFLADEGLDSPSDAIFEHLFATLLQHSHLSPVPPEA